MWFSSDTELVSRPHSAVKTRQIRSVNLRPCHSSNHTAVVLSRVIVVHAQARLPIPPSPACANFVSACSVTQSAGDTLASSPSCTRAFILLGGRAVAASTFALSHSPLGMGSRAYARRRLRPRPGATEAALRAASFKVASGDEK
jgi:hypothetical protein